MMGSRCLISHWESEQMGANYLLNPAFNENRWVQLNPLNTLTTPLIFKTFWKVVSKRCVSNMYILLLFWVPMLFLHLPYNVISLIAMLWTDILNVWNNFSFLTTPEIHSNTKIFFKIKCWVKQDWRPFSPSCWNILQIQ